MLETINNFVLRIMDVLLGWMLHLPTDVALIIVAVGTSAILTFTRPLVTRQELLGRCKRDKKKQKQFIREAKRRRDKEAVKRHRATVAMISMKSMKFELMPLLVSIIPIAMLAVWAFSRLAYVPPEPGEPVKLTVKTLASSIGKPIYMLPVDGVTEERNRWFTRVVTDPVKGDDGSVNGMATWTLRAEKRKDPYTLTFRYAEATVTKEYIVDGERYAPQLEVHESGPIHCVEEGLTEYKPFGIIPGIPKIYFQPWLVGYLVICIPFVFALRWITGIH